MPNSLGATTAEVLSDNRRHGKAERHDRQKKGLQHTRADSTTRLSLWPKAADGHVNEHNVKQRAVRTPTRPAHRSAAFLPKSLCVGEKAENGNAGNDISFRNKLRSARPRRESK